jgi:hypothetical protein
MLIFLDDPELTAEERVHRKRQLGYARCAPAYTDSL